MYPGSGNEARVGKSDRRRVRAPAFRHSSRGSVTLKPEPAEFGPSGKGGGSPDASRSMRKDVPEPSLSMTTGPRERGGRFTASPLAQKRGQGEGDERCRSARWRGGRA